MDAIKEVAYELAKLNVPHTINPIWDGWQIRFSWCDGDIVCHGFSYGHENGQVESYNFPWDKETWDGVSVLDPEQAVKLISEYYRKVVG